MARKGNPKSVKAKLASSASHLRRGMPAENSIRDVVDFVSPQGVPYEILKTSETDAYDPPTPPHKKSRKPSDA